MPCDYISPEEVRMRKIAELEKKLKEKSAQLVRRGNTVTIEGWTDRAGFCDACAIKKLRQSTDMFIRNMVNQVAPETQKLTYGHGH